jgi:hypothetical protein
MPEPLPEQVADEISRPSQTQDFPPRRRKRHHAQPGKRLERFRKKGLVASQSLET